MPALLLLHHAQIVSEVIQDGLLDSLLLCLRQIASDHVKDNREVVGRHLGDLLHIISEIRI